MLECGGAGIAGPLFSRRRCAAQIDEAVEKGVLTAFEAESLKAAEALRSEAIKVDDFPKSRP